jgi:predicted TIM-barrel fold metal-dependent hydrolase
MEDLRNGRLDITPHYFKVDLPFYRDNLRDFLPERLIDIHAHSSNNPPRNRSVDFPSFWPEWVTFGCGMPLPNLLDAYIKMFPGKDVTAACFPNPTSDLEKLCRQNGYLAEELERYEHVFGMMLTHASWGQRDLLDRMSKGRFVGIKPYPSAIGNIPADEITIFDYLPHTHLELAQKEGWVVMLHIPRRERLADELNIAHIKEIHERYPSLKLVIAHVGRAYCPRYGEEGLRKLSECENLLFDISANSNQEVFGVLIEEFGPRNILFGSDMPITAMRAKRVCEGDNYVNYTRHADWEDSHTRRCPYEEDTYTFFLYEEILAFRGAAEEHGLTDSDIEDVFFNNACRVLTDS